MATRQESERWGAGRWVVLALLALGVLISFIDRTSISSVLADKGFKQQFALAGTDRGWINSAFFWSYAVFQIPMGWVVDRYGVKWPYALFFSAWCLATALQGMVGTLGAIIALRLMIGAAEAIVVPASYRWIRNNFDESNSGFAVGLFSLGNKFGPAIGAPVAVWFIVNYSWQTMFIATGLVGLLWLMPWMLLVRRDMPSGEGLAAAKRSAAMVPFSSIIRSPVVWGGMITNFCYGYFTFYCMTWMPAYLVELYLLQLRRHRHCRGHCRLGGRPAYRRWAQCRGGAQGLRRGRVAWRFHGAAGRVCAVGGLGTVLERAVAFAARPDDREQPGVEPPHADSQAGHRAGDGGAAGRYQPRRRRRRQPFGMAA